MEAAASTQPLHAPPRFRKALVQGACFGVLALCCSLLLVLFLSLLPAGMLGPNAGAGLLTSKIGAVSIVFMACIAVPLYETVLGQLIPFELLRKLKLPPSLCVALCGALFGFGHFLNSGLGHGVATAAGGTVFALAYAYGRNHGARNAFTVAAVAHMVNNSLVMLLSALGASLPG